MPYNWDFNTAQMSNYNDSYVTGPPRQGKVRSIICTNNALDIEELRLGLVARAPDNNSNRAQHNSDVCAKRHGAIVCFVIFHTISKLAVVAI